MKKINRDAYADMYGPTTGDKIRLADTELFIEVEKDLTTYGEEVKFGGGKVIRDGMGQSQYSRNPLARIRTFNEAFPEPPGLDAWRKHMADEAAKAKASSQENNPSNTVNRK